LILLFLTGVGPLLAWRKSTIANMRQQFLWPTATGVVVGAGVTYLGIPFWSSGLCFALCGFVMATIAQEFWRGAGVRRQATGTDIFTAMVGLVGRSKRRYGGYIVHVGIVLAFLGFAGGGFEREDKQPLTPGQEMTVGPYTVRYTGLTISEDDRKQMVTARVEPFKNGTALSPMFPARWFFFSRADEPTTEVALRRGFAEDLYVVLAEYQVDTQAASIQVKVNPLVNWIWFGIAVMFIGTIIALLPERAFAFAAQKVPAGAATTSMVLLIVLAGGTTLRAQTHVDTGRPVALLSRSPLEKTMQGKIVCMCGTCGRQRINECTCGTAEQMRIELAGLVNKGMTEDQIVTYYVTKYGSEEVLASPIDRGFNRIAWFLPYVIGVAGVAFIGAMAVRWSRRRPARQETIASGDPELERRLDEELRDLD
jgi:cytochrome c-type biogenesis protein CcmF